MKKLAIAAILALAPTVASADPVHGWWKTEVDDGSYALVEMGPCNQGKTCGWIRRTFNSSGEFKSPNIGKAIVIGMKNVGGGKYEGHAWRPSNGKTYIGKMTLKGNALDLAGCVMGGLFCLSQTWTRTN
ncbi:MAG: imidazoleglycerol-phosphate dehydratase [Rhodobacterales bacterium]|nr:MAG: imidazoleglycerol-phosphate dehydratase [Rhodobacterales bacterium]